MIRALRATLTLLAFLTLLLGLVYPTSVWLMGRAFFPEQASGNFFTINEKIIGSPLIGQSFVGPKYFWSRPSATAVRPYNFMASGPSNLNPANPTLLKAIEDRALFVTHSNVSSLRLPIDLVTSSGSGLDPHISPESAFYQVNRVAKARGLPVESVYDLILNIVRPRSFSFLGESRVNVLRLNLALDRLAEGKAK